MDEREQERLTQAHERMKRDFEPPVNPLAFPGPDAHIANALEYIAFQLGQINQNLDQFVELYSKREGT